MWKFLLMDFVVIILLILIIIYQHYYWKRHFNNLHDKYKYEKKLCENLLEFYDKTQKEKLGLPT